MIIGYHERKDFAENSIDHNKKSIKISKSWLHKEEKNKDVYKYKQ